MPLSGEGREPSTPSPRTTTTTTAAATAAAAAASINRTNSKIPFSAEKPANPFAVPDNVYHDSFLDSLWINLFSSRMSAAVEAESFAATATASQLQKDQWPAAAAAAAAAATAAAGGEENINSGDKRNDAGVMRTSLWAGGGDTTEKLELSDDDETFKGQQFIGALFGSHVSSAPTLGSEETTLESQTPTTVTVGGIQMPVGGRTRAAGRNFGDGDAVNGRTDRALESVNNEGGAKLRVGGSGIGGAYTYEDYVALATKLQAGRPERQREVVRGVLLSIFPGWFPAFYRTLFPPSKVGFGVLWSLGWCLIYIFCCFGFCCFDSKF